MVVNDSSTTPASRAGRPARLSQQAVVGEAMRHDIRNMTMRDLARGLGVSHGALYRWVASTDDLIDLISRTIIDRVLPNDEPTADTWEHWLRQIAHSMHDEFLAVPGFATRTAGPHRHNHDTMLDLHHALTTGFRAGGATLDSAATSAYIFGVCLVSWIGACERQLEFGTSIPDFDTFLDTLFTGLPTRQ